MERCVPGTLKRKKGDYKNRKIEVPEKRVVAKSEGPALEHNEAENEWFLRLNHICSIIKIVNEGLCTSLEFLNIDATNLPDELQIQLLGENPVWSRTRTTERLSPRLFFLVQDLASSTCTLWLGWYKTRSRSRTLTNGKSTSCFTTNASTKCSLSAPNP